jgi:hypothetical protein
VTNSVGDHVVAAARPDPRKVHEVERRQSPEPIFRREMAQYGATARPSTRWDHVLLCAQPRSQTDGVPAIVVHRLHPGTRCARASTPHRAQVKIAAPVRKGTGSPRFMAPRIHQTCNTPFHSRPRDPSVYSWLQKIYTREGFLCDSSRDHDLITFTHRRH